MPKQLPLKHQPRAALPCRGLKRLGPALWHGVRASSTKYGLNLSVSKGGPSVFLVHGKANRKKEALDMPASIALRAALSSNNGLRALPGIGDIIDNRREIVAW